MRKPKNQTEAKRDELIEELVSNWVFKIDGKQLYELPLQSLMQTYETFSHPEAQM